MTVHYWEKMRLNKGFLLFELVCSLVILVTGLQAIYFMQAAIWRTIGKASHDEQNFAQGANVLEQKKFSIERDYAHLEATPEISIHEEMQKIVFQIPGLSKTQRGISVNLESNCVLIKDKTTAQILLVG